MRVIRARENLMRHETVEAQDSHLLHELRRNAANVRGRICAPCHPYVFNMTALGKYVPNR